jgi:peroxiredoxin Q/BCP
VTPKLLAALLLLASGGALVWVLVRQAPLPAIGQAAADFALPDQNGAIHRLADYRGRWLVLYFYPRDDTPGCTREACSLRDDDRALHDLGAAVVGVSLDDSAAHRAFAVKHHLPFPLLADTGGRTAAAYGSLFALGPLKFAKRRTFIIAPDGRIAAVLARVDPARHGAEVIHTLQTLHGGR